MDKKKILIIGGSGFIGSHLVKRALSLEWSVVSLGLSYNKPNYHEGEYDHFCVNLNDYKALRQVIDGKSFDYVINCGGYIDHRDFGNGGEEIFSTHFNGLLNLISILDKAKIIKFINIGSSDEYGSSPAPQREDSREQPISPYSLAKVSSSHLLKMLNLSEDFPATTIRLFLVYGPQQGKKRFIPSIIDGCLKNEIFPCSLGNQLRDFCFIDDIVNGVFSALSNSKTDGEVLNLASGNAVKIRDVVERVQSIIGNGRPQFGKIPFRAGEAKELYANINKAKTMLDWEPKISLEEGLQKTIDWYRIDDG